MNASTEYTEIVRATVASHGLSRAVMLDGLCQDWPWFKDVLTNSYQFVSERAELAKGVDMRFVDSLNEVLECYERNYHEDPLVQLKRSLLRLTIGMRKKLMGDPSLFENKEILIMVTPREHHHLFDGFDA